MSPLKANVLIDNYMNTISVTVGKPKLGPSRYLNVYLQGPMPGIRPTLVSQYLATGLVDCYGVMRYDDEGLIPIAKCATLAGCQAVALSDYIQQSGLEIVPDSE